MNQLAAILLIALGTIVGAFGALFMKLGAADFSLHPVKLLKNGKLILGGSLYVVGLLLYIVVLPSMPLSIAYPLTSMSYIWITLLSQRFLGEKTDVWRWAGIGCIILGIVLLSMP